MISYPSGGLNQRKRPSSGMRLLELTPSRVILPWCISAEHRVNRARQLAGRGDAGRGPAETRLLREVVLREPTVGRVLHMRHDGPDERAAQPPIGACGEGAVAQDTEARARTINTATVLLIVPSHPVAAPCGSLHVDLEIQLNRFRVGGVSEIDGLFVSMKDACVLVLQG